MRTSGILLPVSSLPSPYGIGSLGQAAYDFIDFLAESGQTWWQVLPLGPTGYGDSPYQSCSAFASNPYFIDLDSLAEDGYLEERELGKANLKNEAGRIDYYDLYVKRFPVLKKACSAVSPQDPELLEYLTGNHFWIEDYALFMTIKEEQKMRPFWEWPSELRYLEEEKEREIRESRKEALHFWRTVQFLFHKQWMRMKGYANGKGIRILGDIPIYVSADSCELWRQPVLFQTDEAGNPTNVAGCPPDDFSPAGQLWGNPLYDWSYHKKTGFQWWIKRLEHSGCFYDAVRIDHFRGFSGYYSISAGNITAVEGAWKEGPGRDFIGVIKERVSWLPVIAEDLGFLTPDVQELLEYSGFPGMKVLQFGFSSCGENGYLPHNYGKNSVVYTGTHDNPTTKEWAESLEREGLEFAMKYLGIKEPRQLTRAMIRAVCASVADTAIIPMQDWLELGAEARINTPSTLGDNWIWRLSEDSLGITLAGEIREMTELYGRNPR